MAQFNPQQPVWANQPLPSGWEAKYDSNTRRYFYINHKDKTTSWEDPRQTFWQKQQQTHNQQSHREVKPPTQQQGSTPTSAWKQHVENKYGLSVQLVEPDSPNLSANSALLTKLKKEFSAADSDIIKDILIGVSNNESQARNELLDLGYKKTQVEPLPQSQQLQKKAASPGPREPSQTQKTIMKDKYCREFPNCPVTVVDMALEASCYDESKTRLLLESMNVQSTKATSSPARSDRVGTRPHLTDAGLSKDLSQTTTLKESTSKQTSPASLNINTTSDPLTVTDVNKMKTQSKSATTRSKKSVNSPGTIKPVQDGSYVSTLTSKVNGPNSELCSGPNLDNILDQWHPVQGANADLRRGPVGATGPDPTLRCGPNHSLVGGPQSRVTS